MILLNFGLCLWRIKVIFCSSWHDLIDVIELCFWSQLSNFLMKFLYFETIFFSHLIELFFKILNHSLFFSDLLIFIVNDSLKCFDWLLCSLSDSGVFFFVISLNLFLSIKELSGIIFELTGSKLSLHYKGVCGDVHLTTKICKFMEISLWDEVFNGGFKMIDFLFLFHKLLF